MLVLDRKVGEIFYIGDNIEVKILAVARNRVKIGIAAPKEISIVRKELDETREMR